WALIERELAIGPMEQISFECYDDALTDRIAQAAAKALNLSIPEFQERVGRHWVNYARTGPYGAVMDFTGLNFRELVGNLDRMHCAVTTLAPAAQVPSFTIRDDGDAVVIGYNSARTGAEPMVAGLLRGLLDDFGLDGEIEQIAMAPGSAEFRVTYRERAAADAA
ncbi:MAG: hypothetical protein RLZZ08_159, partial [Pseudomonadota bacterium]